MGRHPLFSLLDSSRAHERTALYLAAADRTVSTIFFFAQRSVGLPTSHSDVDDARATIESHTPLFFFCKVSRFR